MSRSYRGAMTAVAGLMLSLAGCEGQRGKPAPEPEAGRVIPLKEIYSTSEQKSLRGMSRHEDTPLGRDLLEIRRRASGAPYMVFVRGDDITMAVAATRRAFIVGGAYNKPADADRGPPQEAIWLAVFLDVAGSAPPAWLVRSVEQKGSTVRLTYSKPEGGGATKDRRHYLYWAPLGKLTAGRYTLELYDADKKEVTLMRRILVPPK